MLAIVSRAMEPEPYEVGELSPLEELPLECWIAIALQSSDRHGLLTAVPLVSQRLRQTLHDPWLRCSVLRAIYGTQSSVVTSARAEGGGSFALNFKNELEQRADLSRWKQQQVALLHSAIQRRSLRTVVQTLADGLDAEQVDGRGITPLYLALKHDNADALIALLRAGPLPGSTEPEAQQVRLPAADASPPGGATPL